MKKIGLFFATVVMIMLFALTAGAASESDLTFRLNADGNSYYVSDCDESAEGALVIPSTHNGKPVTGIVYQAFRNCKSLTSITIPDGVTSIGERAFEGCSSLTSITIPDGVTSIGYMAFYDCESLTSITIPDSVTSIGSGAFDNTGYYNDMSNWENGVLYIGNHLIEAEDDVSGDYAVRNGTKTIAGSAFPGCNSLTSITIPDSVTSIGDYAFYDCESLTSITIPDSVTSIGDYAFKSCTSLTSITIPNGITSIGYETFEGCSSLTSITIPDSVKTIGDRAFYGCKGIKDIVIGRGVESIETHAFKGCDFERVYAEDIKSWLNISFALERDSVDGWLTGRVYSNPASGADELYFDNVLVDGHLIVPEGITHINSGAFYGYNKLSSISIPDSVTDIGVYVFKECENFKKIYISDIQAWMNIDFVNGIAFWQWGSFNPLSYAEELYLDNELVTDLVIPEGTKSISSMAFYGYKKLKSITIPESVTKMYLDAFWCTNLKKVVYTGSIEMWMDINFGVQEYSGALGSSGILRFAEELYIDGKLFSESVVIPQGLKSICDGAFMNYESIERIVIPDSVTSIGEGAFWRCENLTDVYYGGTEEQWNEITIRYGNDSLTDAKIHYNSGGIPTTASTTYHGVTATLDSAYFESNSMNYNHDLARFCSLFTVIGYNDKTTIASRLEDCGFTVDGDYIVKNASQEQVNNFITHKKVIVNGKEHTLIFAAYIGSHKKQWYSNFDPGTGSTHKGFTNAKNYVYLILENYIKDLGVSKDETIILLTGHSRGAATTNLVAKQLIDDEKYAKKENIYAYAFATPNSTSLSERKNAEYERIFNIVNPEDLVTKMIPSAWGYGRYGITYTLPSKTNTSSSSYKAYKANMEVIYKLLLGKGAYHPYPGGEEQTYNIMCKLTDNVKNINQFYDKKFCWLNTWTTVQKFMTDTLCRYQATTGQEKEEAQSLLLKTFGTTILNSELIFKLAHYFVVYQGIGSVTEGWFMDDYFQEAHQAETYCAYMMSMSEGQIKTTRKGYRGSVNCPVDVEIYDNETGELVGRIANNIVDEEIAAKENSVVMGVEGDSKTFWLPSDGDYEIKLIGNDEGIMDYTLSEVDSDEGEVSRVNFFDVEITENKTMTADVEAETFAIEEHVLNCEEEIIEPDENSAEEEIEVYDIEITATAGGYVSESQTAKSGDYVSLVATPEEEWNLVGWYEDDELISTELEIDFVAKSDRNFEVKFEHNHSYETETVDATCTEDGTITYTCSCSDTYTETIEALGHTDSDWITDSDSTCTAEGSKHIECTVCGEVLKTESIAKLPHDYISVVTAPTCEAEGYTVYTCSCGDTYTADEVPALGHTESDWITDSDSTCTAEGSKHIECTVCGETLKTESIAKLPHDYNSVVTAPTCEAEGYTVYTCECGDIYHGDVKAATGHSYDENGTCTVCGEDKTENCTCNCHKGGFSGFIWKILRFFYKLFGMNKICSCGVAHY